MARPPFVVLLLTVLTATLAAGAQQQTTPQTPKPAPPKTTAPAKPPAKPAAKTSAPAAAAGKASPGETPSTPAPPPKPATDVRFKTSYTQGAQVSENVTYLQGARQRVEFPGVVALDQCDRKRSVMLNTTNKKYRVQPYAEPAAAPAPAPAPEPPAMGPMGPMGPGGGQAAPKGGAVTITTTLTDTLERQPMFGFEARRVKSILIKESSKTACDKTALKVDVDAWYIDLPEQASCPRPPAQAPRPPAGACSDTVDTKTVGDVKLGFPVKVTTTTTSGEGDKAEITTSTQLVTELEVTRLDKTLFDIPSDYAEANSTAEVVPSLATGGTLSDAIFGSTADGTSSAAPKKAGTIRIGVLEPVNHTERSLPASALRQDVVAKFNKAPYEALALGGANAAEIDRQAAKLECDYILVTDITDVKTSKPGGIGGTLKKVSGGGDKDKHDVKLDYKLYAVGSPETAKLTGKAAASSGGFGVGSALRLAAFAGQMYFSVMGMGGLMNPMLGMAGMGGGMGGLGGGLFDPRVSAMTSMASSVTSSMAGSSAMNGALGGDTSEQDMRDTVSDALANAAKSTMEQLGKKK